MTKETMIRLLTQAAIWGSSFSFIKMALEGLAPSQVVGSRLVLGAAVLAVVAMMRRVTLKMSLSDWAHMFVAALLANVVPYLLLTYGELHAGAGVAGVLVAGTPLLTLLLATAVLPAERATIRKVVGFGLGFVGVVLVIDPWATDGGSFAARLACFGAAASYAAGYVYVGRFFGGKEVHPLTLATDQLVVAAVIMLPVLAVMDWQTPQITTKVVVAVVLLGTLSTGFANILYFQLIQEAGATTASSVDYFVPIFAVLFGIVLLGESLHWSLVVGGAVVLIGMALAEGRLRRPTTTEPVPAEIAVATGRTEKVSNE